ncbi:MAG: universal stress protein [Cyanobacteria bacterium P01_H01_bin.121]
MFKTIVFPLDRSREAREAADVVAQLATIHQVEKLILLSVVEDPEDPHAQGMTSEAVITELLQSAQDHFSKAGIQTEVMHRNGKPAFVICDVADEIRANLIVMGCRGIGLTEEGAADSVTNRVINLAPCPVLIVP